MIAKKAKKSAGFGGRIDYIIEEQLSKERNIHEQRGKFLNCSADLSDCMPITHAEGINGKKIAVMMEEQARKNPRVSKACSHQIFSFPEGERPSDEILSDISQEFADEFGFTQWLSVKHEDTTKLHVHFVGNTVNNQGKVSVNDSNDYFRLNDFVKYINEKHDLQRVGTIKEKGESSENNQIQRLQKIIDKAILTEGVKDIKSLQNQLLKVGVKSFTQRGITFLDKHSGVQFKGSKLGKGYSLSAIEKRIKEKDLQPVITLDPYQRLKTFLETIALQSKHMEDFGNRLNRNGIDSSNLNNQLTITVEGQKLNETQLGEDYALKNIRFNLSRPAWTSRTFEKERLKIAVGKSIVDKLGEGLQTFGNVLENLRKEGWETSTERKSFTNPKNDLVAYTQLSFKSKGGMVITDSELKGPNTTINPYGMNGILKEIEKINQSTLKTDRKKNELSELIKTAAVKANDTDEFTKLLRIQGVDFMVKPFQHQETGETVETIRFKKNGAMYVGKALGEDLSLDHLRYNINSRSNDFIPRNTLKMELISAIQQTFGVEMLKDVFGMASLNQMLEPKGWKIEVNEKYFKRSEGNFIPYAQFKYVNLDNEHKFVYDYELRGENEQTNDFSAKSINTLIDKNKALLVRNSLVSSLDTAKTYQELAYQLYSDSGIVMDQERKMFETKEKTIPYKAYLFYLPTQLPNQLPTQEPGIFSQEAFKANWDKLIDQAKMNRHEKVSLSDVNQAGVGSQITNADISDILTQNKGSGIGETNEFFTNEFGLEQRATFLEDLKKIILGKVSLSGHAQVKGDKEPADIRSTEEKRRDELRRKEKIIRPTYR